jgi:hypothetical protein
MVSPPRWRVKGANAAAVTASPHRLRLAVRWVRPFHHLQSPPSRQRLIDALALIDEASFVLTRIGYEEWADLLTPTLDLIEAEARVYPENAEEAEEAH